MQCRTSPTTRLTLCENVLSRQQTPPRISHILGTAYLAELLSPTYAKINHREVGEVYNELKQGLEQSGLHAPLCAAIWHALQHKHPGQDDATVLDALSDALVTRVGMRRPAAKDAQAQRMNALFVGIDAHIGRASNTARSALESPEGQRMMKKALDSAADFLAAHW